MNDADGQPHPRDLNAMELAAKLAAMRDSLVQLYLLLRDYQFAQEGAEFEATAQWVTHKLTSLNAQSRADKQRD